MTREEILINSVWTSGKIYVYSEFFKKEVKIDLFTSDYNLKNTKTIISQKFVHCINDFLNLSINYKPLLQQLLYKHCLECCTNISYGIDVLDNETETQANLREFGVTDAKSAFEKANLDHVTVEENELKHRYVKMVFYPEWEDEHGCELILKNGDLLDYFGESGTYLLQFED